MVQTPAKILPAASKPRGDRFGQIVAKAASKPEHTPDRAYDTRPGEPAHTRSARRHPAGLAAPPMAGRLGTVVRCRGQRSCSMVMAGTRCAGRWREIRRWGWRRGFHEAHLAAPFDAPGVGPVGLADAKDRPV